MSWQTLSSFRDRSIGKLHNLKLAARAGIDVPNTWYTEPGSIRRSAPHPPPALGGPWIVRSGSPREDTDETSHAGQLLSLVVTEPSAFADAVRRVADEARGEGVVFVQPLLRPDRAGVAFFDGFYYEATTQAGGNVELTGGTQRGDVSRGHVQPGDPWTDWLQRVHHVFRRTIDIEFAEVGGRFILLQARPALFKVRRNPTLSLANHREILGDPPSEWICRVIGAARKRIVRYFAEVDPEVASWDEEYAMLHAQRVWINLSFFFRLMDHWGLPRSFVTEGIGGAGGGGQKNWKRMLFKAPRLVLLQAKNLWTVLSAQRALQRLDRHLRAARTEDDWFNANVEAVVTAVRVNFGINGMLTGVVRIRKALGIRGEARVVTLAMMEEYDAMRGHPERLDAWLQKYGHRGPFESDPARPRFHELRELLAQDLASSQLSAVGSPQGTRKRSLWFWVDRRREWWRDELMKRWQVIREGLSPFGVLELPGPAPNVPDTAPLDEILSAAAPPRSDGQLAGISLFEGSLEGTVKKAREVTELLAQPLPPDTILVVPALEPSWAVVFGRVAGVVAEIGGELSHASILLREARKPAIVNCQGAFAALSDGDRVRLDGASGRVETM